MTAAEKLLAAGYKDVVVLDDRSYDDALVGVTLDNRAVYDFNRMISGLVEIDGFTEEQAAEWIQYNTIDALPFVEPNEPVIIYFL